MQSVILLVDDDKEDQFIFCDALQAVGCTQPVHVEKDGAEALRYVSSASNPLPCIILADLNMPKMSGSELLTEIKANERLKEIPFVIYTTSVNEQERARCLQKGAHAYITKPLSYKQSIEVARMIMQLCIEVEQGRMKD